MSDASDPSRMTAGAGDGAERGVCGSAAPALATVGGRLVLVGTPYALEDVIVALERGERPPGLGEAHIALAEAAAVRRY
jgi:hypothetical protein